MNKTEYLELLQKSKSFAQLEPSLQLEITNAEGQQMESYAEAFRQEADLVSQAYQELKNDTDAIVADAKKTVVAKKKIKLAKKEIQLQKQDLSSAEKLLKNL